MDKKQQIRKYHILKRNKMTKIAAEDLSAKICSHLTNFFRLKEDLREYGVYGYFPHGKEVSLVRLYVWLLEQKIPLAFPRTEGENMDFYNVSSMEEFTEGAFRIMEPKKSCKRAGKEGAFCLIPGSVFDRKGNRFGYGMGYYDRYLSVHKELYRIGIAYDSQIEEKIPTEEYDIKMQAVATEKGIYFFS